MVYEENQRAFPQQREPVSSVALFDFDGDGELDLYSGNWFDSSQKNSRPVPDGLYRGERGFFKNSSFLLKGEREYSKEFKTYTRATPTSGVMACDVDQNGYTDILVASSSGFANKMWLNLPHPLKKEERSFVDYAQSSSLAFDGEGSIDRHNGGHTFYAVCADYNNDGVMDLALGELFHSYSPESRDRSSLLRGVEKSFPPRFIRTEYHQGDGTGFWSQGDRRAIWWDYNLDGRLDLLVDNSGFPPKVVSPFFAKKPVKLFGMWPWIMELIL